jgi:hypothetical protein
MGYKSHRCAFDRRASYRRTSWSHTSYGRALYRRAPYNRTSYRRVFRDSRTGALRGTQGHSMGVQVRRESGRKTHDDSCSKAMNKVSGELKDGKLKA